MTCMEFVWRVVSLAYKGYMVLVDSLGPPWTGLVHSTVFMTIGQTVAWLLFGL